MTLIPVAKLPERHTRKDVAHCDNKSVRTYLREFMKMNVKYALVDYNGTDYSDVSIAHRAIRNSVIRSALPIHVTRRSGHVYVVRKDLEDPDERL